MKQFIKFQNTKSNRLALTSLGYSIHDPHYTFNRKGWIIISEDNKYLLGVNRRSNYKQMTVEDYKSNLNKLEETISTSFLIKYDNSNTTNHVSILKHKDKNTYSYVNLTKGHICPCIFNSIQEAIDDLKNYPNILSITPATVFNSI